jgi:4-amino-4-deoxy-L-arabinose transferase-like glycosyltransferase
MVNKQEKLERVDQDFKASDGIGRQRGHWNALKTVQILLVVCLFLFTLVLNFSRAVRADYNHDEDQFIASARLLLDEGLLPYRDYPYFHTPYLVFVYALLFALTGSYNLLTARLFSAVCTTASVMLVFWMVLYFFRNHSWKFRYLAAVGIMFLYLTNPLLAATAGFSWNHNLSVLCMLGSLWLVLLGSQKKSPGICFFASGALLGIAVGVRISSITILPAFLLALIWLPGKFLWRRFIHLGSLYIAGFGLALLPLLWLFIIAPQQFIFGNLGYAQLNSAYRLDVPVAYDGVVPVYGTRSLADKLGFLWNDVLTQPANLLLFAGLVFFGWSVLATHLRRKDEQAFRNILTFAAIPLVAVGSFFPTPTWYQYFYAPLPFALLAIAVGLTYLTQGKDQVRKWFMLLLIQLVLFSIVFALQDFRRMSFLRYVDLWKPLEIHQVGMDIRERIGPDGQVFTLAPLYPLEGGLKMYTPIVTGVFAFRTGSLLSAEQRQHQGIVSRENFEDYLDKDLPEGILVGFDQVLEDRIIQFAVSREYKPQPLDNGLTLWVRPDLDPP